MNVIVQKGSNDFHCFVFAWQPWSERNFGARDAHMLGEIGIKSCLLSVRRSAMPSCALLRIAAFVCAGADAVQYPKPEHLWSVVCHYFLADRGSSCAFAPHDAPKGSGVDLADPSAIPNAIPNTNPKCQALGSEGRYI